MPSCPIVYLIELYTTIPKFSITMLNLHPSCLLVSYSNFGIVIALHGKNSTVIMMYFWRIPRAHQGVEMEATPSCCTVIFSTGSRRGCHSHYPHWRSRGCSSIPIWLHSHKPSCLGEIQLNRSLLFMLLPWNPSLPGTGFLLERCTNRRHLLINVGRLGIYWFISFTCP